MRLVLNIFQFSMIGMPNIGKLIIIFMLLLKSEKEQNP